jgi:hypothetical protein
MVLLIFWVMCSGAVELGSCVWQLGGSQLGILDMKGVRVIYGYESLIGASFLSSRTTQV